MRPLICLLSAAALLQACAAPVPPAPADDLSSCGGTAVIALIGQPVSALPPTGGWATLRVIHPGEPVTEDYSATRLNVQIDGNGLIRALNCG